MSYRIGKQSKNGNINSNFFVFPRLNSSLLKIEVPTLQTKSKESKIFPVIQIGASKNVK